MDNVIEKKISLLVEQQFPSFYREEGPTFIQFVKTYYEWLEETGNVVNLSRNFLENKDIDDTLEEFLYFFQKKYLYGIPFDVIINKRYLLKHVLDIYRSKGTIQAYKLLFKLIFEQDIDVYLPSRDVLRVSDGTWKSPKYLEVSNVDYLQSITGKTIVGITSKTVAIVETFVIETVNKSLIGTVYISNIQPKNGQFIIGEKIVTESDSKSANISTIIQTAPVILGSLDTVEIINGGANFQVGDLLKVAKRDITTGDNISNGIEGIVRVKKTGASRKSVYFSIIEPGTGLTVDADVFVYNNPSDTTGSGADFDIEQLSNTQYIEYNTDILASFADMTYDSTAFGFDADPTGNVSSTYEDLLSFETKLFGGISKLTNVRTGLNYTQNPNVYVRSTTSTHALAGNVSYDTTSANVVGDGTEFTRFFVNNDVLILQANSSNTSTIEKHIIKTVSNNTVLILHAVPTINSTISATYKLGVNILPSNFAYYEPEVYRIDGKITGLDSEISGDAAAGNNTVLTVECYDSGRGYLENESVKMYLYGALDTPTITLPGNNYTNGDILFFSGGGRPANLASAYVTTNSIGSITSITMTYAGVGYDSIPTITVRSNTGTGAVLTTTIKEFTTDYEVTGKITKAGIGKKPGYWTTTRGFLNSDKYIQDSYFYQDFSYQIKAGVTLNKYRDIMYNTFHPAGTELFGKYFSNIKENLSISLADTDRYLTDTDGNIILDTNGYPILDSSASVTISTITNNDKLSLDHTQYYNSQYLSLGI